MDLDDFLAAPIEPITKGWPALAGALPLSDVGRQGWNVLRADATVMYESVDFDPSIGARLGGTQDPQQDGFLSVKIQPDPNVFR